jgi:hypothetical protein
VPNFGLSLRSEQSIYYFVVACLGAAVNTQLSVFFHIESFRYLDIKKIPLAEKVEEIRLYDKS